MTLRSLILSVLIVLAPLHVLTLSRTGVGRATLPRGDEHALILPSPLLRVTSLGYKGLVADFMFLDLLSYYGGTLQRTERPYVKEWEWKWFEHDLRAITDLDPYFFEPYYFGNAIFSWEARRVEIANDLLAKGTTARTWDWVMPFFAGFNYFYFLENYEKAAEYIMEASRRPEANPMLGSLASKLAFKEQRTETAIQFLEETLTRTEDVATQDELNKRIETLRRIRYLEQAVDTYRSRFHQQPSRLEQLVQRGIISAIPPDPFEGYFYIAPDGVIKSTMDQYLLPSDRGRRFR